MCVCVFKETMSLVRKHGGMGEMYEIIFIKHKEKIKINLKYFNKIE